MASLRLLRLKFRAGAHPTDAGLDITIGNTVILVGPNNSGKSLTLRELYAWCIQADQPTWRVVENVEADFPMDPAEGIRLLRDREVPAPPGTVVTPGNFFIHRFALSPGSSTGTSQIAESDVTNQVNAQSLPWLRSIFTGFFTIKLDGRSRFGLVDPQQTGDLLLAPQNHLWALFLDDAARENMRRLTAEAFPGRHVVIDPTPMQQFRLKISAAAPTNEEHDLSSASREFFKAAQPIADQSDGVQAFVGMLCAVLSQRLKIVLIDEPEAFLHPPLARRLGSNLAKLSRDRDGTLVAATHSAECDGLSGVGAEHDCRATNLRRWRRNRSQPERNGARGNRQGAPATDDRGDASALSPSSGRH